MNRSMEAISIQTVTGYVCVYAIIASYWHGFLTSTSSKSNVDELQNYETIVYPSSGNYPRRLARKTSGSSLPSSSPLSSARNQKRCLQYRSSLESPSQSPSPAL